MPDSERALSRLALDRGGPRDLAAVRDGLAQAEWAARGARRPRFPEVLVLAREGLAGHDELISLLDTALVEEPPYLARDGGFVAPGFDEDLDDTRRLRDQGRGVVAELQAEYVRRAGSTR